MSTPLLRSLSRRIVAASRRLLIATGGAALLVAAAIQPGCVRDDPAFRVSDMAAAPTIVGEWKGIDAKGQACTLKITESVQAIGDGRLLPRGAAAFDEALKKDQSVPVYNLQADFAAGQPDKDGKATPPSSLNVRGYLLKSAGNADSEHFLCIQSEEKGGEGLGNIFTINTQWMLSLRVDGDRLTIRMPSVFLLLSPATKLLDPPAISSSDAAAPAVEEALKKNAEGKVTGGAFLTNDADRALGVLRRYGSRPEFWQEEPLQFSRVK